MPSSNLAIVRAFLDGKKRKRLLEKKREEVALLAEYAPALATSKYIPEKFFCRVTGRYVPKIEKLVVEHCSGKRFTVGQAKVVGKKQALLEERDPSEGEAEKARRKEENKKIAEKLKQMRMEEWEQRQIMRKMAMQEEGENTEEEEEEEEEEEDEDEEEEEDDEDEEEEEEEEEEAPKKKRRKQR